jgi:hypothetical protein
MINSLAEWRRSWGVSGGYGVLSEQAGQTDEIEGGHGKGEWPVDLGAAGDTHLAKLAATVLAQPKTSATRWQMCWESTYLERRVVPPSTAERRHNAACQSRPNLTS